MNKKHKHDIGDNKKAFTFVEIMITLSLFMILASLGTASYFNYYRLSLINNDINNITKVLHETRFKAMKNPYNSDYGVYINSGASELTTFRDTYTPGNNENIVTFLEQTDITQLNLMPNPGVTNVIVFENTTGKTQNSGSFTVGKDDHSRTFYINLQGAFE
ncbi:prepilin-type N-terminal cleavage/methylation domain-containing protein [Patescibacteria group bacterium]|nr:prepilin-type N-terminal cleavage/methylation domain-containing protein [Patescibacteria group bacterium]